MKLLEFDIQHYRSIKNLKIMFPTNKPLILFGPNNAGKTNILSALNIALGESYPTSRELEDSDYYLRNKEKFPNVTFHCLFDGDYYTDKWGKGYRSINITYNYDTGYARENLFHDGRYNKLYVTAESRSQCQAIYLDAIRNIGNQLSYASKYTLLSKFSAKIHKTLKQEKKDEMSKLFEQIKDLFNDSSDFQKFFDSFRESVSETVKGFVHTLDVDFSGYDPNNFTKSLRIVGKEGDFVRSFEELGTGEQQTLLMAFVKAYMETFNGESFILIIEEPEAHLHPIAQRWLKKYMNEMCSAGIQVVISTHSPEFIDAENLEGLAKVYKENGVTKIKQINAKELRNDCVEMGVPAEKITDDSVLEFYSACLYADQLKGLFAEKIILVEGDTEVLSLPKYFERIGFNLEANGVEIVRCQGKNNILKYYRFFKSYGYTCFCLFDADEGKDNKKKNDDFIKLFGIQTIDCKPQSFICGNEYAYFGFDFESYMRSNFPDYEKAELKAKEFLGQTTSKPLIARYIANRYKFEPAFIKEIVKRLNG